MSVTWRQKVDEVGGREAGGKGGGKRRVKKEERDLKRKRAKERGGRGEWREGEV